MLIKIMKIDKVILALVILTIVSSCGVSQAEYDKLKSENEKIKTELNECKFGADKLIAKIEKAYSEKRYSEAIQDIANLAHKHPESPKNKKFSELLTKIEQEQSVKNAQKAAIRKEKIRLANINNTGMWSVEHYVDEFGEPTKQGYISNTNDIQGTFSNTATQSSDLNVTFLITSSSKISFQLYEYAKNNPVKAYSSDSYTVMIQDKDGKRYKLAAENYSDRLTFDSYSSKQVQSILLKGGSIKFKVIENESPTTQYEFVILNADWYENAYKKLKGV
jgi:hypothetical protein